MESTTVERVIMVDCYRGYRYIVPSRYTNDFLADDETKWRVLESIGIERRDDTTPLRAWRDAVAIESGMTVESVDPEKGGYLDLGFSDAYVRKFVFFLA